MLVGKSQTLELHLTDAGCAFLQNAFSVRCSGAQAQGLALAHVPSGYKLALNQAFELAQNAAPYDDLLAQALYDDADPVCR